VHTISHRVASFLERQGILERDEENNYLNLEEGDEDPISINLEALHKLGDLIRDCPYFRTGLFGLRGGLFILMG
jgi:hypothetical protein